MTNPNTVDRVAPAQPLDTKRVLDALPGLIGGIDRALLEASGKKLPFVLLVFAENGAMHATNIHPASRGVEAVKQLARAWESTEPVANV